MLWVPPATAGEVHSNACTQDYLLCQLLVQQEQRPWVLLSLWFPQICTWAPAPPPTSCPSPGSSSACSAAHGAPSSLVWAPPSRQGLHIQFLPGLALRPRKSTMSKTELMFLTRLALPLPPSLGRQVTASFSWAFHIHHPPAPDRSSVMFTPVASVLEQHPVYCTCSIRVGCPGWGQQMFVNVHQ